MILLIRAFTQSLQAPNQAPPNTCFLTCPLPGLKQCLCPGPDARGSPFRTFSNLVNAMTCPSPAGSEQEQDYLAVLSSVVAYLKDQNAWATLACLLTQCATRGCELLSSDMAGPLNPLSPGDFSPESVAALCECSYQHCESEGRGQNGC